MSGSVWTWMKGTKLTSPVTVYSTDTCPWCDRTKEFLTSRNVPFVDKNVAQDMGAAVEMVRRSGQQGVPVVATEDEVIVGFDQVRLARLAERYAGPKRPAFGVLAADATDYFARHPEAAPANNQVKGGVYVGRIRSGTVADKAGIQAGDIITGFAGKRVKNLAGLDQLVESVQPGDAVSVALLRDGEERKLTLQF